FQSFENAYFDLYIHINMNRIYTISLQSSITLFFILFLISESFAQYTDNFEQWSKKVAITLVGRMPTVEEHEYFKKINSEKNYDSIKQEKIIDYFIKLKDFNMYLSIQFREELLEGVDREEL